MKSWEFNTPVVSQTSNCSFEIVWHTRQACPVCKKTDLILYNEGKCDESTNTKIMSYRLKNETKCLWMTNETRALKDNFSSELTVEQRSQYVLNRTEIVDCSIHEELMQSGLIIFVLKVISACFALLICCLLVLCCRYRRLQTEYQ